MAIRTYPYKDVKEVKNALEKIIPQLKVLLGECEQLQNAYEKGKGCLGVGKEYLDTLEAANASALLCKRDFSNLLKYW